MQSAFDLFSSSRTRTSKLLQLHEALTEETNMLASGRILYDYALVVRCFRSRVILISLSNCTENFQNWITHQIDG